MSLGCARCGDCCDPVGLSETVQITLDQWREVIGNPDSDQTGVDPSARFAIENWVPYQGPLLDTISGHRNFRCTRFNSATRLCEAYEDRPPVCDSFPWYHGGEGDPERVANLPPRCSYALDVAPLDRRPDARPLIPLTVVKRAT